MGNSPGVSESSTAVKHQNGNSRKRKKKTAGELLNVIKQYSASLGKHKHSKLPKFSEPSSDEHQFKSQKRKTPIVAEPVNYTIRQSDEVSEKEKELLKNMPELVALDCEMVRSIDDPMALARCTIVSLNGTCLLDEYVRPKSRIVDYVSRYSGIYPRHMVNATPHDEAKEKIMRVLQKKVVVGHSIHGDFRSIGISVDGNYVVDINKNIHIRKLLGIENNKCAFGLKRMCKAFFKEDIQKAEHCSYEDAWSTMKVFKLVLQQWVEDFKKRLTEESPEETVHHAESGTKKKKMWERSTSKKAIHQAKNINRAGRKWSKVNTTEKAERFKMISEKRERLKVIAEKREWLKLLTKKSEKETKAPSVSFSLYLQDQFWSSPAN